jgi:YihY family inner membrane protein
VKNAAENFSTLDGTLWAASFAYYAFFSLFPLLLLLVTAGTDIATRFVGEEKAKHDAFKYTVEMVEPYLAVGAKDRALIADTVSSAIKNRGSIGLIAFVSLLWSSLGFFQALVGAINKAWGEKALNWWKLPLKSLLMLGVLGAMMVLGVLAPPMLSIAQHFLEFDKTFTPILFAMLTNLVGPVVLFCGFMLFYKLAPRRRSNVRFGEVWIPALVVTALLKLCQELFVLYSTRIANFNAVYGTFGGVIALMLWTYLSGMVIIFGGCLCAAFRKRT